MRQCMYIDLCIVYSGRTKCQWQSLEIIYWNDREELMEGVQSHDLITARNTCIIIHSNIILGTRVYIHCSLVAC